MIRSASEGVFSQLKAGSSPAGSPASKAKAKGKGRKRPLEESESSDASDKVVVKGRQIANRPTTRSPKYVSLSSSSCCLGLPDPSFRTPSQPPVVYGPFAHPDFYVFVGCFCLLDCRMF